VTPLQDGNNKC